MGAPNNSKLLYASTTWMSGLQVGEVITEYNPVEVHNMNSIYGATKLSSEMILEAMVAELPEDKAPAMPDMGGMGGGMPGMM